MAVPPESRTVEIIVNGQRANASLKEMNAAVAVLTAQFNKLSADDPGRAKLLEDLQELKGRVVKVREEIAGVSETTNLMKEIMTHAFSYVIGQGIEEVIFKVIDLGKSIFETTAKFEKYGAVLENALGSKSLGQKALKDIQEMAAKTPFSVDELTSSFIKFVNRGLQPSMADLSKLGDLAASQGKSFDQLTEAVLDAGTGEFERLKEFGISASKSGDQVSLSFKGVNQTVANTPEAINAAILAFGEMKGVAGGMAMIAATLDGEVSNLGDTADQTAVEWGQTLKPVFVAVLSTLGFLLGVLKELPSFIKENRGLLLGLGAAVLTLNGANVAATASTLAHLAVERARAIATRASAAAQWLLNAAMEANPVGLVVAALAALAGLFVTLYERSETFRKIINGLGSSLKEFAVTYVQGLITALTGLGDVIVGVFSGDWDRIKKGVKEGFEGAKAMYLDAGANAAKAFGEGYRAEEAKQVSQANRDYEQRREQSLKKMQDYLARRAKEKAVAAKKNRLEELKNEEAELKERLVKTKADSEAEMRIKQQLVTNNAAQLLENDKKTAAERRIILAEAEDARVKLAQEFFEKQAKAREAARKKVEAEALKARLADIEAEQHHQEMKLKLSQAAMIARGDERVSELSSIYTDGELKIAALTANSKKEIAKLEGTAAQKKARTLELEKELAAEVLLVKADVLKRQQDLTDKFNKEDQAKQEKFIDEQLEAIDEQATRQQAGFDAMLGAGLASQRTADELKYQARQAAFAKELLLIEASLGKESGAYKKVFASMLKDQDEQNKKAVALRNQELQQKKRLQQLEMSTAGDVLSFGLQLLDQDADARKKHHALYAALAAAKIIIDGTKEVQQIWEYSAENPANGPSAGTAGIIMGGIQTAVAVARTAMALSKIGGGGSSEGGGGSYWQGGATGDGSSLAVSPMGQLLQLTGMSVGAGGKLQDGSGFAVAGVVHEDEYVVPKWMRADPQVAAVEQWLEARRLRGFADGGPTTSGSSGATLPIASASPSTDGEKTYAVQTQMLAALLNMNQQLADVKQWQASLQVQLNLGATKSGLNVLAQAERNSGLRRSGS